MKAGSRWKNFSVWRGRLPHWRADDVTYYVTFRHRRDLNLEERRLLFRALQRPDGRDWSLVALCVLPDRSSLVATLTHPTQSAADPLSKVVERAKTRVGNQILKRTEERYPPFYAESYDRIVRDEAELGQMLDELASGPAEHVAGPEEWETRWIRPTSTDPEP